MQSVIYSVDFELNYELHMIRFRQINVRLDCCSSERTDLLMFSVMMFTIYWWMDGWCLWPWRVCSGCLWECSRRAGVILLAAVTHKLIETPAASPACVLRKHRHPEHESSRSWTHVMWQHFTINMNMHTPNQTNGFTCNACRNTGRLWDGHAGVSVARQQRPKRCLAVKKQTQKTERNSWEPDRFKHVWWRSLHKCYSHYSHCLRVLAI